MKKSLQFAFVAGLVLSTFFFGGHTASASTTIDGINGNPVVAQTVSGSNVAISMTGSVTDAGMHDYTAGHIASLSSGYLGVLYGQVTDPSKVTQVSPISTSNGVSNPLYVKCSLDTGTASPTYEQFTCNFTVPSNGSYVYTIGYFGIASVTTYYTGNSQFVVTALNANQTTTPISVSFGSATVTSSTTATVIINVANVPAIKTGQTSSTSNVSAQATIQLAVATQVGATSVYTCTQGSWTSPLLPVSPTTGPEPIQYSFSGLPPGGYCARLQVIIAPGTPPLTIPVPGATDNNGFFNTPGVLFFMGGVVPANGATNNAASNPTGCVTKGDNTNYCLLAPLPGVGDNTGNLQVTNFSNYFTAIIKIVFGLIGVLSVLMITIGGIEYMTTVSIGEKEGAKNRITSALLGLLLALTSYIILNTINPNLVNLGVSITPVQVSLNPDVFTPTSGGGQYTGGTSTPNVSKNITTYDSFLSASSQKYGVSCTLMKAFMYAESGGNPSAASGVGAKGLIQLMPATFQGLGYDPSLINDPATNIDAAAKYVSQLQSTACNGSSSNSVCNTSDPQYVIAAYNGGAKANGLSTVCQKGQGQTITAWQCTLNSGYAETRNYVPKVLANQAKLTANNWGC